MVASAMTPAACPPHFYKYSSFGTARIVLTNGRLRWTTASLLNDPFDMGFDLHMDIDASELRRLVKERFRVLLDGGHYARTKREDADLEADLDRTLDGTLASLDQSLADMHRESRQWTEKTKILCLTVSPGNMLMWSHYAEQHSGAVLRFSTAGENNAFQTARPVTYSEEMPRFLDTAGFADMILGANIDTPATTRKQIFTKASAWSYEQEWRINFGLCRDPEAAFEDLRFGEEELDGVILGCRMPPANRLDLVALARSLNPDVEIFEAVPASRAFRMDIRSF
ncbi:DUF2971 domain-containing protein [Sphingomonas sp. LB-2]|uniref:DUF2971 domain-containing protein n=1 Tax=Sphingomonas caeni TaxID=2984949 RepID=UPI00222E9095|nr:DUF2971 domain-containing protein [Sphingomonas caeni]MCW3847925.1 DUF2971 domain-containing protein [Sphingomonas caeni]